MDLFVYENFSNEDYAAIRKVCKVMMSTNVKELLKDRRSIRRILALVFALLLGSAALNTYAISTVSYFPESIDPIMEATILEEEPPLAAAPKTVTKTSTKTTSKNVKLSKAATKTYTSKLPTTVKTTTTKTTSSASTVTTVTTVSTAVTEKYTKKSAVKVVTTAVTTTIKTTTAPKPTPTPIPRYTENVDKLAPKMNAKVRKAFKTLNFKVYVDSTVSYSGYFNSKNQSITLNGQQIKSLPDTVYHELGHFLAFIAGNVDTKADFQKIYSSEKSKFTGTNKAYATQSSSEFFAECVKLYYTDAKTLKKNCPKTYAAIEKALGLVTDARVAALKKAYAPYWKY